jgi:PEP-CTERM motif-containing protein
MPLDRVPCRWLLALFGVLLPVLWPSVGAAVLISGSIRMDNHFGIGGAIDVNTSDPATIGISFAQVTPNTAGPTGAGADGNNIDDQFTTVGYAGQTFSTCGSFGPFPCAFTGSFSLRMFVPRAPDPPVPGGGFTVTVPGTFTLSRLGVGIFGPGFIQVGGFGGDAGPGPASLTFKWEPQFNQWLFDEGEAQFGVTPEPTTLLLFATSAAGLGVASWRRRRHT